MSDSGVACGYVDFDDETLAKIEASDDNLAKKGWGVECAYHANLCRIFGGVVFNFPCSVVFIKTC